MFPRTQKHAAGDERRLGVGAGPGQQSKAGTGTRPTIEELRAQLEERLQEEESAKAEEEQKRKERAAPLTREREQLRKAMEWDSSPWQKQQGPERTAQAQPQQEEQQVPCDRGTAAASGAAAVAADRGAAAGAGDQGPAGTDSPGKNAGGTAAACSGAQAIASGRRCRSRSGRDVSASAAARGVAAHWPGGLCRKSRASSKMFAGREFRSLFLQRSEWHWRGASLRSGRRVCRKNLFLTCFWW